MERLNPLNDFLFLKLLGEEGDELQCLAFLNAVLNSKNKTPINVIKILENRSITADIVGDKSCILDVRVETDKGEKVNIEVQLKDFHNMEKRTVFYWGEEFTKGIGKGDDYIDLPKVITINIVNYDQIKLEDFHTCFHLWEDENKDYLLTDILEIHFLNMVKFRKFKTGDKEKNPLVRWLTFFDKESTEDEIKEVISMDAAISIANERLTYVSQDQDVRRIYEMREKALRDWTTGVNTAIEKREIEIAKNLLKRNRPLEEISEDTGLDIETIKGLQQ